MVKKIKSLVIHCWGVYKLSKISEDVWNYSLKMKIYTHSCPKNSIPICRHSRNSFTTLASMTQLVEALSHKQKVVRFNSRWGHIPMLRIQSPVWVHMIPSMGAYGREPIHVSVSHECFSLSLSPFLSLKAIKKCLQVRIFFKLKKEICL